MSTCGGVVLTLKVLTVFNRGSFVALARTRVCSTLVLWETGLERRARYEKTGVKVTVLTFLLLASRALCLCSSSFTVVFTLTPWYTLGLSAKGKQHVTHVY